MNNISVEDYIIGATTENYYNKIPSCLVKTLLNILDNRINNMDDISKLFMIQYSYFIKINNQWLLKNLIDVGTEKVFEIKLLLNDNFTGIHVYSRNKKYDSIFINKLLDTRKKSTHYLIYATDLYTDFEPYNFIGKCYTA